jgi:hypothetical protein
MRGPALMAPTRRETLTAAVAAGLGGCAGVDPTGGGKETATPDPVRVGQSGGGIELVRHRFEEVNPDIGPELFVTLRNTRDAEVTLGELFCRVYDGEELIADSYRNVAMEPNETKEFDSSFELGNEVEDLRESTRYEIEIDAPYANGVKDELYREFDQPVTFVATATGPEGSTTE